MTDKIFTDAMALQMNNVIVKLVASFNQNYGKEAGHVLINDEICYKRDAEILNAIANIVYMNDAKTLESECGRLGRMGTTYGKRRKEEDENDN